MRKNMKKFGVTLMTTAAMMAAVNMTTFAAGGSAVGQRSIVVQDAEEGASIRYAKVIEPNAKMATGWHFASAEASSAYRGGFGMEDEQAIISMLLKAYNENAKVPASYAELGAASRAQIDAALERLTGHISTDANIEVDGAGLYAILITGSSFTYRPMAAFLGFDEQSTTVEAKKAENKIQKSITNTDAADQAVAVGDIVNYSVKSVFPYFKTGSEKTYTIRDVLTGAKYDKESVRVILGEKDITSNVEISVSEQDDNGQNTLKIDLSSFIDADNNNAGAAVEVIYRAEVTNVMASNTVEHSTDEIIDSLDHPLTVFTGKITLTKTNEDGNEQLAGAGFELYKDGQTKPLTFKKTDSGSYLYDTAGNYTELFTQADGRLIVEGLDEGTYHFKETTAPDGYSINEKGVDVTLTAGENIDKVFTGEASLANTKLGALPSTGSIGTFLFTGVGVGVMAFMAGMFTLRRRPEDDEA